MIYYDLSVKFRAFFVTLGTVKQKGGYYLLPGVPLPNADHVVWNKNGIFLRLSTQPIP